MLVSWAGFPGFATAHEPSRSEAKITSAPSTYPDYFRRLKLRSLTLVSTHKTEIRRKNRAEASALL